MIGEERPTWLIVLVSVVTGYCLAKPSTLVGAFREDGLPFILVGLCGLVVLGLAIATRVMEWQDRREHERRREEYEREERRRRARQRRNI